MATVSTLLKYIYNMRTDWIINVRLSRKWVVPRDNFLKAPPSLELAFVEKEGCLRPMPKACRLLYLQPTCKVKIFYASTVHTYRLYKRRVLYFTTDANVSARTSLSSW